MNSKQPDADPLRQLIDRKLRELPLQRAPIDLQARVWAGLRQQASLPWWRKSFSHWPLVARVALVVLCLGVSAMPMLLTSQMNAGSRNAELATLLNTSFSWADSVAGYMQALLDFMGLLLRHAPAAWLFGAAITSGLLYAAFISLGGAVYRTLQSDLEFKL
jgi:hypothetical protein